MGNLEFTLNSIRWEQGNDFMEPEAGEKWLVVNATLNNIASESANVSSLLMFELIDDEHYSQDWNIFADTKGSLDGELGSGRSMRGEIAYTVSENASSFEFIFAPNFLGFGQAIYVTGAEEVD